MYDVMKNYGMTSLINHLAISKFFRITHHIRIGRNSFSHKPFSSRPHIHDHPQIWYCNSGEYTHLTRTGRHECHEGSLVIIPPGCPDDFEVSEGKSVHLTCIDINLPFFENTSFSQFPNSIANLFLPNFADLLGYEFNDFMAPDEELSIKVNELIESINMTVANDEEPDYLPILNSLEALFSIDSFRLPEEHRKKALELSETIVFPMLHALAYINKNFSRKLTASECAKVALICRTNFFKAFHSFAGIPFSEYLKQLRVVHATILLVYSPFSISYIANLCGYSDAAYMSNCIKKYTSRTPKERKLRMQEYYSRSPVKHNLNKSSEQILETYTK